MLSTCGVGEDSWESLGQKGDQTSQLNQPWIFIGRTDAEGEVPILWSPDVTIWLIGKDPDAGKDWGQEGRGWLKMRWLDGIINSVHMSLSKLWTGEPGVLQPMGSQRVDMTEWLNTTKVTDACFKFSFFNLAWTHGFRVVAVRVRILSLPPHIPRTCKNPFMWLKHLCRYEYCYKSGDRERSLYYPGEPHLITQSLKRESLLEWGLERWQHGRTLRALAGFEDGGRRLQAKGIGCL